MAGDAAAYETLLRELAQHLRAYFRARLYGRSADAEDLTQDTLLAIHQQRASYDASQPLTAWVYAIARYKLIDHLRREGVRLHVSIDGVGELFASEQTDAGDAAKDLTTLMRELPPQQRLALKLIRLDQLSTQEAAAASGMSETSVRVNAHRGIKRLIAIIKQSHST
jgi:RNA polymerase sigma-70 factor (ECF subfamily)